MTLSKREDAMLTYTIKSFEEYIQYTEKYRGNSYFRGQADASWDITPSISRHYSTVLSINDELELVKERVLEGKRNPLFCEFQNILLLYFECNTMEIKLVFVT